MRPKPKQQEPLNLFHRELSSMLNPKHRFCLLAERINWSALDEMMAKNYSEKGRPGANTRLMIGLHLLKSMENLSDERLLEQWLENPYFQYFTGESYFQHKLPIDRPTMTKFRKRLGEEQLTHILTESLRLGLETKALNPRHFERIVVDTTVQPKAITYPTDGKLMFKAIIALNRFAKAQNINLRQSYIRVGKRDLWASSRAFHARKFKHGQRHLKALRTKLGRLMRDIDRKCQEMALQTAFSDLKSQCEQIIAQTLNPKHKPKIYSLHEPHVQVFSKGKAHAKFEFGNKVSISISTKISRGGQFILGCLSLEGAPFDGHTLKNQVKQVENLSQEIGAKPVQRVIVDRGYKCHGIKDKQVFISGAKRGVTPQIRRELKRRQAVEPVIGHAKSDCRMDLSLIHI